MKHLLRKLHRGSSSDEASSEGPSKGRASPTEPAPTPDAKPLSALSGWLNTVARHTLQTASPAAISQAGSSKKDRAESAGGSQTGEPPEAAAAPRPDAPAAGISADEPPVAASRGSDAAKAEQPDEHLLSLAEEYQVQLAMALSANDDPEAVQIERVKQISLNSNPSSLSSPAEVLAYQYWNYNVLNYDDKIVDGFYDVYGVVSDPATGMMPSLVDLQGASNTGNYSWEVVLVNRATDPDLVNLEQSALMLALDCKDDILQLTTSSQLIQRIADLVVMYMGGPVVHADDVLKQWRISSEELKLKLGSIVLSLGWLRMGLARHRALLFKVLADAVGIPCRLVKGRQYTGSDGALNVIRMDDKREYIIDLMGMPGTLIPSDGTELLLSGLNTSDEKGMECGPKSVRLSAEFVLQGDIVSDPTNNISVAEHVLQQQQVSNNKIDSLVKEEASENTLKVYGEERKEKGNTEDSKHVERHHSEPTKLKGFGKPPVRIAGSRSSHPFAHWRSPSWTEGVGSPAVHDMKVKDVSQYMMDAAKENPDLAQKLHNVLLESGVKAPLDLFSDISPKQLQAQATEGKKMLEQKQGKGEYRKKKPCKIGEEEKGMELETGKEMKQIAARAGKRNVGPCRPPAPPKHTAEVDGVLKDKLQRLNSVEGLGERRPLAYSHPAASASSPTGSADPVRNPASPVASVLTVVQESLPPEVIKRVPVAAAAAATAAVVASSMVVAAAKSDLVSDATLDVPVAAAATATAAVVVATSAVVGRKLDAIEPFPVAGHRELHDYSKIAEGSRKSEEAEAAVSPVRSGEGEDGQDLNAEEEKVSDKSTDSASARSNPFLDDVAELEIIWEDITIGERIGLGSYGEVYRGELHGTEVAVKKFLNQDISRDALEEFRSEVRIMRRMRHPNVVLFMGAVTRAPNLSIVTEFLPRGSLYRLIHRPNNQLDERKRMRMALDVARGMNYLHSGTPIIVHRDLKSPNLLVDKNWVVKVCDFGLSQMKHNTFLSSKSTAGTPEWMAPEVLRNEPSNEKCDVYSFGVILWELATLQQPWNGMNPMQVVGAVGFQHRHLVIPDDMDPAVAKIICQCWESDPNLRPSFADILAILKPLQKSFVQPRVVESGQ